MRIIKILTRIIILGAIFNLYFSLIRGGIEDIFNFAIFICCGLVGHAIITSLFINNQLFQKNIFIQMSTIFFIATVLEIVYGTMVGFSPEKILLMVSLGIPVVIIGFIYWWQYSKKLNTKLAQKKHLLKG
ncbi:hypothetical protein [Lactococcus muris]|uniref:hypothetical protein n=1 Tax=Lactococcus muris TaxID=2941330 RepID=UPI00203D7CEB|nr:hypothetical protein [Lactococcus muris]